MIQTNDIRDNVHVDVYDTSEIADDVPGWDDMDSGEQLEVLESDDVRSDHSFSEHNAVLEAYRRHIARLANPQIDEAVVEFTHMAFGDNNTLEAPDDEGVINEVYRASIEDFVIESDSPVFKCTLLIGSDEAVGIDLIEASLVSENDSSNPEDMAANRVLLDDPEGRLQPKDADSAVTIRIEISYLDVSQV